MAKDWFTWKGESCKAYGIRVLQQPPIVVPLERVTYETVSGRSGSLKMREADGARVYDDIQLPFECIMDDLDQLHAATAWLQGDGVLSYPGRPGGWYTAAISQQISMEKILAVREHRQFTLNFRADPYFYLDDSQDLEGSSSSMEITNPGTEPSAPRIAIYGTGSVGIDLAGQVVTLRDLEGGIVLDTELLDALSLDGAELLTGKMTGKFPTIPPGHSTLTWFADETETGGSVTKIVITPRWRCT